MAGLNKVMIIGNLGADPEMRYMADGTAMTSFRVATTRTYTSPDGERREETEWFSVTTWRKLAEQCSQFLQKGRKVYVEGRMRTRSWDGADGQRRYRTEVVADRVLFLDRMQGVAVTEEPDVELAEVPFELEE
ncbi:MAG TPA: single-stranded DNA-binding protein [Dehalococcoidia bacterium]|nr:single-stranded DNA-binding protein [Dehalococcoidia bacterium]